VIEAQVIPIRDIVVGKEKMLEIEFINLPGLMEHRDPETYMVHDWVVLEGGQAIVLKFLDGSETLFPMNRIHSMRVMSQQEE